MAAGDVRAVIGLMGAGKSHWLARLACRELQSGPPGRHIVTNMRLVPSALDHAARSESMHRAAASVRCGVWRVTDIVASLGVCDAVVVLDELPIFLHRTAMQGREWASSRAFFADLMQIRKAGSEVIYAAQSWDDVPSDLVSVTTEVTHVWRVAGRVSVGVDFSLTSYRKWLESPRLGSFARSMLAVGVLRIGGVWSATIDTLERLDRAVLPHLPESCDDWRVVQDFDLPPVARADQRGRKVYR